MGHTAHDKFSVKLKALKCANGSERLQTKLPRVRQTANKAKSIKEAQNFSTGWISNEDAHKTKKEKRYIVD